jgi:hypothetical protein
MGRRKLGGEGILGEYLVSKEGTGCSAGCLLSIGSIGSIGGNGRKKGEIVNDLVRNLPAIRGPQWRERFDLRRVGYRTVIRG